MAELYYSIEREEKKCGGENLISFISSSLCDVQQMSYMLLFFWWARNIAPSPDVHFSVSSSVQWMWILRKWKLPPQQFACSFVSTHSKSWWWRRFCNFWLLPSIANRRRLFDVAAVPHDTLTRISDLPLMASTFVVLERLWRCFTHEKSSGRRKRRDEISKAVDSTLRDNLMPAAKLQELRQLSRTLGLQKWKKRKWIYRRTERIWSSKKSRCCCHCCVLRRSRREKIVVVIIIFSS